MKPLLVHHRSFEFTLGDGTVAIFDGVEYPVSKLTVWLHQGTTKSGQRTELERVSNQNGTTKIVHLKTKMGDDMTLEYAHPLDAQRPPDLKMTISGKMIRRMLDEMQKANPDLDVPKLPPEPESEVRSQTADTPAKPD